MFSSAESISPSHPLHGYQRQVLSDLLHAVLPSRSSVKGRRAVAHMPTGAGKTRVACHAAAAILNQHAAEGRTVFWLASSEELCDQAAHALAAAWSHIGNRPVALQRFWGGDAADLRELQEGFLVAGLAKLYAYAKRQPGNLAPLASMVAGVIFDEAHQAVAPTYSFLTEQLMIDSPPLIGLTATPGRSRSFGDQDLDLAEMFDSTKVTIDAHGHENAVAYLIKNLYLAEPAFYVESVNSDASVREPVGDDDYRASDLRALGRDDKWLDAVIAVTSRALRRHRRVIVFCPSVACARTAAASLASDTVGTAAIVADTPVDDRTQIIERFRNDSEVRMALFNYGVLTAGFDAPRTSCVVIARPTNSLVLYSQMVGRAMRGERSGGNRQCDVYSVVGSSQTSFGSIVDEFTHWEELWHTPQDN